ncbi:MAG: hypothetical protein E5V46_03335 [Mesorhizobium sp.]|nr:MAG: hypothetical protein E5V46_03335 [Mesorhizobium sp.]
MNQHVNRRSIMGASVGLAAIAVAAATAENNAESANTLPAAGVAPELQALKKAFDAEFRKFEKTRKIFSAAEKRYFAIRPPKPEILREQDIDKMVATMSAMLRRYPVDHPDLAENQERTRINQEREEAWEEADSMAQKESGFADADAAYGRQHWPTSLAANRILRFKARSLDDVKVKLQLHRRWGFDIDRLMPTISTDIKRIAKVQRAARERVDA